MRHRNEKLPEVRRFGVEFVGSGLAHNVLTGGNIQEFSPGAEGFGYDIEVEVKTEEFGRKAFKIAKAGNLFDGVRRIRIKTAEPETVREAYTAIFARMAERVEAMAGVNSPYSIEAIEAAIRALGHMEQLMLNAQDYNFAEGLKRTEETYTIEPGP